MNNFMPLVNKLLSNNQVLQNPMVINAVNLAKNNDTQGLKKLAENIAKEKGTDIKTIRSQLGI